MSKKMLKRSLALGALMAFVITGSAYAEVHNINTPINTPDEAFTAEDSRIYYSGSVIAKEVTIKNNSTDATIYAYGDVTVQAKDGDVNLHSGGYAIQTSTESDGAKSDLKISISGYNINLSRSSYGWVVKPEVGSTELVAENDVVVNGTFGLSNNSSKGLASVTAGGSIIVHSTTGGTVSNNGSGWNLTAGDSIELIAPDGQNAIYSSRGSVIVNADNNTVIEGNIKTSSSGSVNVDFDGNESYLTGAVIGEGNTVLTFNDGATWNVTGASTVSEIGGTDANIKVANAEDAAGWVNVGEVSAETLTVATETNDANTDSTLEALSKVAVYSDDGTAAAKQVRLKNAIYDSVTATVNGLGDVTVDEGSKEVAEANIAANDMAAVGLMSWRAEMNDMNKRMGELRNANGDLGVWVRMVRGESEYNSVKNQYNQYQLGYDEKLSVDKRWTVGAAISYTDAENNFAQGSGESTNKALSIYGSKLNADGTFVDLIAKYARLENEFDIVSGMGDADYSTNGYSFSAEFGKRIQQGNGLWIEPQVELTYGKVSAVDYVTANGVNVAQDGMESLVGRVGFSLGKDVKGGNVYARASYLYDFEGETKAILDNDAVLEQDLGGGWWEVGVGANINLSKATYIYADVEKTFGGEVDTNWQWNLGVRYSF